MSWVLKYSNPLTGRCTHAGQQGPKAQLHGQGSSASAFCANFLLVIISFAHISRSDTRISSSYSHTMQVVP